MKKLSLLFALFMTTQAMAAECPQIIQVAVKGLKSISAENETEIEKIFKLGEEQTDKEYIQTILKSVNEIASFKDVLVIIKSQSNGNKCQYKGNNSTLTVTSKSYDKPAAVAMLKIGRVNYEGNSPSKAWGFQSTLKSDLTKFDNTQLVPYKNRKSILTTNMLVQIPLGDYGTDGYDIDVKIGAADSVTYKVIQ